MGYLVVFYYEVARKATSFFSFISSNLVISATFVGGGLVTKERPFSLVHYSLRIDSLMHRPDMIFMNLMLMPSTDTLPWYYWLYQPYKWLVFAPLMLINSIVFAILAALFALLLSPRAGSFMGSCWARITCWLTPVSVFVSGKGNITPKKSYVIVANHQTGWDIFLLYGYLPIDFRWIMKKELRKVPFIGYASEKVGHVFIDRTSPRSAMQSLEEAKRKLVNGNSVLIFPEGTRSRSPQMRPFKKGAFKLAYELGLDVLPVTIVNSYQIKRNGFFNLVPGKAGLVIHPMIHKEAFVDDLNGLINHTREVIGSALPE